MYAHRRHSQLLPAVAGELKAPVKGTKEGQHNCTVRHLKLQCLVEDSDRDARVDVRHESYHHVSLAICFHSGTASLP